LAKGKRSFCLCLGIKQYLEFWVFWDISLIFNWGGIFYCECFSVSLNFNRELLVRENLVVWKFKCNFDSFNGFFTFPLYFSVAFNSSALIQNFIVFFTSWKSNCCKNSSPISRNWLGFVFINTNWFGQIMLCVNLFLKWETGGHFGNLMSNWHPK